MRNGHKQRADTVEGFDPSAPCVTCGAPVAYTHTNAMYFGQYSHDCQACIQMWYDTWDWAWPRHLERRARERGLQ